nr:tubulin tyrosine ligase 3-like isoform X1 [Lytechinus pictus]
MQTSVSFNKLQDSAYCPNTSMSLKRLKGSTKPKHLNHKRGTTYPTEGRSSELEEENEPTSPVGPNNHTRSKTNASPELSPRSKARYSVSKGPNIDRLRNAKIMAEKAMKTRKIFTIQGPYPVVRASLMRRSWVEKEYRLMNPHKYKKKNACDDDSDSDDDDDIDDDNACDDDTDAAVVHDPDGVCGIMSRMVRNATPSFLWTVRKGAIDYRLLRKDTIVNHFCKNGTFTTKVGLCLSLKSLPWFEERDADTFFPRCYRICADEEKDAFVGDYRISAAIGVMKWIVMKQDGDLDIVMTKDKEEDIENKETDKTDENKNITSPRNGKALKAKKTPVMLGTPFVNVAIKIVEDFLTSHEHDDIDEESSLLSDEQWDKFITEYYQLTSEGGSIDDTTMHYAYCDSLLNRLRSILPQLDMQGFRNIWIVKPGAKSRGRGIMCMNKLDEILKLVGNPMVKKEGKWVVQKYIERPLLIYQTKFDIRQWFLVTDWNPLTIWWYDACYLRFCTQPFSLDDLGQSIHLSNQSIQKNYDNASARDPNLPEDNMWDSDTFRKYLDDRGYEGLWESVIVPGMKKAIIDSMLCAQDAMEARKNSFELYGADFMLTDDFLPWMLEINASPAMGASTPVTEEMCASVIEDTMKVVLDRKHDKNCDTGKFEILYKGPSVSVPPYIGASICVDGIGVSAAVTLNRQKSINNVISPRQEVDRRSDNQRSKTPGRTDKVSAFQKLGLKTGVTPKATTMEDMKKKLAGIDKVHVIDSSSVNGCISSSTNSFHGTKMKRLKSKKTKANKVTKTIHLPSLQYKPSGEGREELKPTQVMIRSAGGGGDAKVDAAPEVSTDCENNCDSLSPFKVVKSTAQIHGSFPIRELPSRVRAPTVGDYEINLPKPKCSDEGALVKQVRSGARKVKLKLQHNGRRSELSSGLGGTMTESMESWCSLSL